MRNNSFKKYLTLLRLYLQNSMMYKLNTFMLLTITIVPPVAYYFLWKTVYIQKGIIGGYTFSQILTYYIISIIFHEMQPSAWHIGTIIKDGRLSLYLSRPLSVFGSFLSTAYGYVLLWWFFSLSGGALLFLIFRKFILLPSPLNFFYSLTFAILAGILNFTVEFTCLLFAFFIENPFGIARLYRYIIYFLGGSIIPLDLLPFKKIFLNLPFKYLSFFPTQIFLGRVPHQKLFTELLYLLLWTVIAVLLMKVIYEIGRRMYTAPGTT